VRAQGIRSSKVISLDKHEMLNHMLFFDENTQKQTISEELRRAKRKFTRVYIIGEKFVRKCIFLFFFFLYYEITVIMLET